ncbi:MAG: hypothetical protein SF069_08530 [Phycisphaerae bacterium]|nr:hypothetical protein [Phycisphaerae bacterium]
MSNMRLTLAGISKASVGLVLVLAGGCQFLANLVSPNTVQVRLQNDGDFDVAVSMYVDGDQNVLSDLIEDQGTLLTFTLSPGEVQEFTRDCDDLQAIVVDNAELRVLGQIGPETSTDVLRDGDDFMCGDRITFTFDHSAIFTDFRVNVAVSGR